MALTTDDKKTIRQTIIRSVVLSVIAGLTTGALATFVWLRDEASDILNPMPTNNTVAISLVACDEFGSGWSQFEQASGRFIIGAGDHDNLLDGAKVSEYTPFEIESAGPFAVGAKKPDRGGAETVTLAETQMPRHSHSISSQKDQIGDLHDGFGGSSADYGLSEIFDSNAPTSINWARSLHPDFLQKVGNSEPHDNMPPYIALYFCKKD